MAWSDGKPTSGSADEGIAYANNHAVLARLIRLLVAIPQRGSAMRPDRIFTHSQLWAGQKRGYKKIDRSRSMWRGILDRIQARYYTVG